MSQYSSMQCQTCFIGTIIYIILFQLQSACIILQSNTVCVLVPLDHLLVSLMPCIINTKQLCICMYSYTGSDSGPEAAHIRELEHTCTHNALDHTPLLLLL